VVGHTNAYQQSGHAVLNMLTIDTDNPNELELFEELKRCLSVCDAFFKRTFRCDYVLLNLRGKSAGQYRYDPRRRTSTLRFNKALLDYYGAQFIEETVGHEVAHLVVHQYYGRNVKPHGAEWQYVMKSVLNQEPTTRHRYDLNVVPSVRKTQQFSYVCKCIDKVHKLGATRHNRASSGVGQYACRRCKAILNYCP